MRTQSCFVYFAYGSNLKLSEMRRTCPSANRKCKARLPNHRLIFPRESITRHCGVASVQPSLDHDVWGGVYFIAESERAKLEQREGYRPQREKPNNSYVPEEVIVFEEGDPKKPLVILTFIAIPQSCPPLPSDEYKSLIIVGASEWNLDSSYLAELEKIETLKK
jgi:hypothetical protein